MFYLHTLNNSMANGWIFIWWVVNELYFWSYLTLSWRRPISYRNQSIDLRHEMVKRDILCEVNAHANDLYYYSTNLSRLSKTEQIIWINIETKRTKNRPLRNSLEQLFPWTKILVCQLLFKWLKSSWRLLLSKPYAWSFAIRRSWFIASNVWTNSSMQFLQNLYYLEPFSIFQLKIIMLTAY